MLERSVSDIEDEGVGSVREASRPAEFWGSAFGNLEVLRGEGIDPFLEGRVTRFAAVRICLG